MENIKFAKERQDAVKRFFMQYELRKRLSEVGGSLEENVLPKKNDDDARAECARRVVPFDTVIASGQVRLFSKTERITYALIVKRWGRDSWLVLPFSDYREPATDAELKIKVRGGVGLRVIQLWNARSLLDKTLEESWLVAELNEEDVEDVLSAWEWSVGVGELSEDQLERTGLPIMRRDDCRIEYENSEIENFAKLDAEDLALTEHLAWQESVKESLSRTLKNSFVQSRAFDPVYALAAADVSKPVSADCHISRFDGVVHVRYNPLDKNLNIHVFGSDDNCSQELDGWGVFGSDSRLLGFIDHGCFSYKFDSFFDGILSLADEDANVASLLSEEE